MKVKKSLLLSLPCVFTMALYAQDLSVGLGVGWDPYMDTDRISLGNAWTADSIRSLACMDGFAFFDASYLQVTVGYIGTGPSYTYGEADGSGYSNYSKRDSGFCGGWLYGSAMLEWPFRLKGLRLSPQAGLEYDYNLSFTDAGRNDLRAIMSDQGKSDLNRLWFRFGGACDIPIMSSLYARVAVNVGLKNLNQSEKDYRDAISQQYGYDVKLTRLRMNLTASFAYRVK